MVLITTSTHNDAVTKGFDTILMDEWPQLPMEYTKIVNVKKATSLQPKVSRMSTYAVATTKTEGSAATEKTFAQMYDVTYTLYSYSFYNKVSRELKDNDLYEILPKMPRAMMKSHKYAREVGAANLLNNAFSGSYVGGDSVALCSAVHPLVTGTASNTRSIDLDRDGLELAMQDMRATVDDQGKIILVKPTILLVPPELESTAYALVNAELDPESANNTPNWVKSQKLTIVVNDLLTDADAWFLLGDQHFLTLYTGRGIGEAPELIVQATTDLTLDTIYQTYDRFGTGWDDWRGVWGSPGA